jgi:hydrogenase maturation factor
MKELIRLLRYLVVWISQNLSIPFWVVGHVHLTMNVYSDLNELLASIGMNLIVAVGFIISYIDERKNKN